MSTLCQIAEAAHFQLDGRREVDIALADDESGAVVKSLTCPNYDTPISVYVQTFYPRRFRVVGDFRGRYAEGNGTYQMPLDQATKWGIQILCPSCYRALYGAHPATPQDGRAVQGQNYVAGRLGFSNGPFRDSLGIFKQR